jgi:hypothetical protein
MTGLKLAICTASPTSPSWLPFASESFDVTNFFSSFTAIKPRPFDFIQRHLDMIDTVDAPQLTLESTN